MDHSKYNRIFLTGATGFIGSHLAEYFSRKGYQVICGVQHTSDITFLRNLPVKIVYADVTNFSELVSVTKGVDAVVHAAGKVTDWGRWNDFHEINVNGTRNVLMACLANGVKRVIVTGSVSCYGEENSDIPKDEQSMFKPHYPYFMGKIWPSGMNYYRESKAMAIIEAEKLAAKYGANLIVIHPVWVYGEREFSSGFYEYMKFAKSWVPFGPGCRKNKFHVVYVRDLCEAYELALRKAPDGFQSYIIGNPQVNFQDEIFRMICREMGVRKPWNLPKALIWPVGLLAEVMARLFGARHAPFLSRARVNLFYDSIQFSTKKAEKELAFYPRYSLEEGIKNTVRWYKENGLI
jgi:nucleoside-diphosphate-sugar epimerase